MYHIHAYSGSLHSSNEKGSRQPCLLPHYQRVEASNPVQRLSKISHNIIDIFDTD
jgi:hypothetical protein